MSALYQTLHLRHRSIVAFAGLLLCSFPVRAADVLVGTPALNPAPDEQFDISLFVDVGSEELGSYAFEFLYDPFVVRVVSIGGGTTSAFSAAPVTDPSSFSSGTTPLAAVQSGSNIGLLSVATLTLEAVGGDGSQSTLDAAVLGLFRGDGNPLSATVFASSVLIVGARARLPTLRPGAYLILLILLLVAGRKQLLSQRAGTRS